MYFVEAPRLCMGAQRRSPTGLGNPAQLFRRPCFSGELTRWRGNAVRHTVSVWHLQIRQGKDFPNAHSARDGRPAPPWLLQPDRHLVLSDQFANFEKECHLGNGANTCAIPKS